MVPDGCSTIATSKRCSSGAGLGSKPNPMTERHLPGCSSESTDDFALWQERVRRALRTCGGRATREDIEDVVAEQDPSVRGTKDWKGKIWNVILLDPEIGSEFEGLWDLMSYGPDNDE